MSLLERREPGRRYLGGVLEQTHGSGTNLYDFRTGACGFLSFFGTILSSLLFLLWVLYFGSPFSFGVLLSPQVKDTFFLHSSSSGLSSLGNTINAMPKYEC